MFVCLFVCCVATIISHNVPPYSRSGLYNELRDIRALVSELMSDNAQSKEATRTTDESTGADASVVIPLIVASLNKAGLFDDLPYPGELTDTPASLSVDFVDKVLAADSETKRKFVSEFSQYATQLLNYLSELEQRLFSEGLHEFGGSATVQQLHGYLSAVCDNNKISDLTMQRVSESAASKKSVAEILLSTSDTHSGGLTEDSLGWSILTDSFRTGGGMMQNVRDFFRFQNIRQGRTIGDKDAEASFNSFILDRLPHHGVEVDDKSELLKAAYLSNSLAHNPAHEMSGLLAGLSGQYVPAAPGGDLIRDGNSVLPTGRNIYALDPYRIPSPTAYLRGCKAADLIIKAHQSSNNGAYPETVAVTLWGLDTIKTKGESVGIVLGLVGAEPVREATGRIVSFSLIPLEKLGRPRIDVLARYTRSKKFLNNSVMLSKPFFHVCSLSGIFRDSFENVLDLLDKLFEAAATADEPDDLNYIKKHTKQLQSQGEERPYSRLFSNAPGDFGSMVGERVGSGEWESASDLGDTWQKRNSFSYGRTGERGASREGVLKQLLNTTDRIVQEIDCVE